MKKVVYVRGIPIGDGKITIQSMTNTKTFDVENTSKQIIQLSEAGANIVRVSIPDIESANAIKELSKLGVPLVGDIHFSHIPALIAMENGIDKIRINPANLSANGLNEIVKLAKEKNIPIRVGVNKGSFSYRLSPKELAEKAVESAKIIEDIGYDNLVLAVKTSDVLETVEAYKSLSKMTNYPLHLGLTESGTKNLGCVKSAIAIGSLLLNGIGDTIRVSLSAPPVEEVYYAKKILRSIGYDKNFVEVISCPTCARTCIDVEKIASEFENITENLSISLKVAVMGCVVNGIGESKGADFGICGGKEHSSLIIDGKIIKRVKNSDILSVLKEVLEEYINDRM